MAEVVQGAGEVALEPYAVGLRLYELSHDVEGLLEEATRLVEAFPRASEVAEVVQGAGEAALEVRAVGLGV